MSRGRLFLILSWLAIATLGLLGCTEGPPWPTYQGNPEHTGYVPVSLNTNCFSVRWRKVFPSQADLNPVTAADGKVFVSEYGYFSDAGLFVLNAHTGRTEWNLSFGSVFSVNPPAYAYGNVYIQTGNHSGDTYLRAYDADTGSLLFRAAHEAQWERYYAPSIYDGKVYIDGGSYGGMYCFDAFTGLQEWFHDLNQYDQWTPAVDPNYAYAYVGEYSPGLYVLDRFTGDEVFVIPDPNFDWNGWSMNLAPVLGSQGDVVAIHNGRLVRFDLLRQDIAWEIPADFSGQVSVAGGAIYCINAGSLNVRDQATGDLLWAWEVPSQSLMGSMIVTDTHVLTRSDQAVYAVSLSTRKATWSHPASGHLSLSENTLYIACEGGVLIAINSPAPILQ